MRIIRHGFTRLKALTCSAAIFALCLPFPATARETASTRPTLDNILEMRSIDGLTPSPDGRSIAFRIIAPDVTRNEIRSQWYRADLDGDRPPTPLGVSQHPLLMPQFGVVDDPVARWSPDSTRLYVLEVQASEIQVHALTADGDDHAITHAPGDVTSFEVAADGRSLHVVRAADRVSIAAAQAQEAVAGIHLDQSVITDGFRLTGNYRIGDRLTTVRHLGHPVPEEEFASPSVEEVVSLPAAAVFASSQIRPPSPPAPIPVDYELLTASKSLGALPGVPEIRVRTELAPDGSGEITATHIEAKLADGTLRTCPASFCSGLYSALREAVLNPSTGEVMILADEDYSDRLKIHGWNPLTNTSRIVWESDGALSTGANRIFTACPVVAGQLVCILSGPTRPAELVAIDLASGRMRVVSDPNAALAAKQYPVVRRLQWRTPTGLQGHGIFVAPYGPPGRAPLVVTSYGCSGFLRGGTARVTPEFILAQHGIASLCYDIFNPSIEAMLRKKTMAPLEAHKDDVERILAGVDMLIDDGLVDRNAIGLSGQSYSSNVVAYAISHSGRFKAASIGTGVTIDPMTYYLTAPTRDSWRKTVFPMIGLPAPTADPRNLWDTVSPARNASRIKAALLIQPPESEYSFALQLYTSIADTGGKVDMFVFPEAGHMMESQPAQARARANRSIAWFRYWLTSGRPEDMVSPSELKNWDILKGTPAILGSRPQ